MKRLRICALALAALFALSCAAGLAENAKNVTKQCRFKVSEGSAGKLTDKGWGDDSAWKPRGSAPELGIQLPEGGAAYIHIDWLLPPTNYTLTQYDANQAEIASHSASDDSFACISQLLPLEENARYAFIRFQQEGQGISRVRVFSQGELPATVVEWEKPLDKCDLLVVSTHQDDEWLWFGAIIPYYDLVQDKDVQVVYMANCGRYRYGEALNSIAVSGVRTYPYFVGLKDKRDSSLAAAVNTWKSKDFIVETMVGVIRRFKPEVILTHDWNGEYGHPQHVLTSRCMEYAIEAAADESQYPESAQEYGAWQVKKLYRHLEKKGRIEFDWHVAYDEFGGRTGIQVATDSMKQHASQLDYFQVEDHGKYDNALFGLSWSAVGDDVEHKDLFENVESTPEPTPEPTATPEATPTPAPTSTPEPTPELEPEETPEAAVTAAPAPEAEGAAGGGPAAGFAIAGVGLALCGGAGAVLWSRRAAQRKRLRKRKGRKGAARGASARKQKSGRKSGQKPKQKSERKV